MIFASTIIGRYEPVFHETKQVRIELVKHLINFHSAIPHLLGEKALKQLFHRVAPNHEKRKRIFKTPHHN